MSILDNVVGMPITRRDRLFLRAFTNNTSAAIIARVRWMTTMGQMQYTDLRVNTSASVPSFLVSEAVQDGIVISVSVIDLNGELFHGELYAQVGILSLGSALIDVSYVLAEGYVTRDTSLAYPDGIREGFRDGPGHWERITVADPAEVTNWEQTVPDNEWWEILDVSFLYVTSGTAQNREVQIRVIDDAGRFTSQIIDPTVQAASLSVFYSFSNGGVYSVGTIGATTVRNIPTPPWTASPGGQIGSAVANMASSDQQSNIRITKVSWMVPE